MNMQTWMGRSGFALLVAGLMATGSAYAAKPDSPGNGKGKGQGHAQVDKPGKGNQGQGSDRDQGGQGHRGGSASVQGRGGSDVRVNVFFGDRHRSLIHDYFVEEHRRGHCPPGLAKKHNGCLPPGQAKKWALGRPLPRDVIYYDLPRGLVIELGAPPAGHKYVRVAADILLIAVGTSMVVDAITDLGSL